MIDLNFDALLSTSGVTGVTGVTSHQKSRHDGLRGAADAVTPVPPARCDRCNQNDAAIMAATPVTPAAQARCYRAKSNVATEDQLLDESVTPVTPVTPKKANEAPQHGDVAATAMRQRATAVARTTLEALHPATVAGVPLTVVLDHAGPEDYADLVDQEELEAFARALAATGTIRPQDLHAPQTATGHAERPVVCCGDCQHFQPDTVGDGSGIGRCAINAWRPGQPALYPRAPRRCGSHQAGGPMV